MRPVPEAVDRIGIELIVNAERRELSVPVRRLLVDVVRDDLGLTGTHVGCEHGICGACTLLLDGAPVRSCITLAVQADGMQVTTIEGVTPEDGLTPMQQAFKEHHALQCGFCTPGFLMTLAGAEPAQHRDESAIRRLLAGNLCRCTGYENIVRAVKACWGVT